MKSHIVITCQFSIRDISKLWFFVIHVSCKKKNSAHASTNHLVELKFIEIDMRANIVFYCQ